jgi:aminoglycoside phosphotransferase (APT) family kinase protein
MPKNWIDRATDVRKGEELNNENLSRLLKKELGLEGGELVVEQFPGGFSNLTYLLRFGEVEYVLRRPPVGAKIKSGHDMGREYKILHNLKKVYSKVPQTLFYTEDENIIGASFYIMEKVKGVILRSKMPNEMIPDENTMSGIAKAFVDNFTALHSVDFRSAGLSDLGKPEGYVERQIKGWTKRYFNAKTDEISAVESVAKWLLENMPSESGNALIHNDYKYDNLVLDTNDWTNILAVLDWEMSTLGDPLMDLGTSLGYWINHNDPNFMLQMKLSPTTLPGNPKRGDLVKMYANSSGRDISNVVFYYVYGLFKIAVIIQQIYFRYQKGLTQDERFANLIHAVKSCGTIANQAINKSAIDDLF